MSWITQQLSIKPQRSKNASSLVLLAVALTATFCLIEEQSQLAPIGLALAGERNGFVFNAAVFDASEDENDEAIEDDGDDSEEIDQSVFERDQLLNGRRALGGSNLAEEKTEALEMMNDGRRSLLNTFRNLHLYDSDYDAAFQAVYTSEPQQGKQPPLPPIPPYSIADAIKEADVFEYTFAVLVYNPQEDNFVGLYSKNHGWAAANKKLFVSMSHLSWLLRKLFPERFTPDQPELALAVGSGDYPHVRLSKLPYTSGVAPVFEFGSAFRDTSMYPNMIPMPMPERRHLLCYEEWVNMGTVCKKLRAAEKGGNGEMVFGEESGLEFDDLIPQVMWRGSDFAYLPSLTRPRPVKPYAYKVVEGEQDTEASGIQALRNSYDKLLPRWKGVTITAESEQEAKQAKGEDTLPWANIKFSKQAKKKTANSTDKWYLQGETVHQLRGGSEDGLHPYTDTEFTTGGFTSLHELANYKYQIDLGGGGGTTWTGTIQKLAMPGLLFHHVTPTKDYIHDHLQAWRHYIPVSSDLTDLQSKFEWAESHPEQAKWIADQGTAFMRNFISKEGYGQMFQEAFVEPLRQAIESYTPVSETHPGMTWMDAVKASPGGSSMDTIAECSGLKTRGSCKPLNIAHGRGGMPKASHSNDVAEPEKKDNTENHIKLRGKVGSFREVEGLPYSQY